VKLSLYGLPICQGKTQWLNSVRVCFTSMLFRVIETAIVILTEVDDICDGRIPIVYDIDAHGQITDKVILT